MGDPHVASIRFCCLYPSQKLYAILDQKKEYDVLLARQCFGTICRHHPLRWYEYEYASPFVHSNTGSVLHDICGVGIHLLLYW